RKGTTRHIRHSLAADPATGCEQAFAPLALHASPRRKKGELMPDTQPLRFRIHEFADRFPLISDDEMLVLANDIAVNGLRETVKLDHTGTVLVDGRNLRACQMAGVEPTYERLPEGTDLIAYIISANLSRRHLTGGQRAVAFAIAHPEKGKGGRGHKLSTK